jgi:hypothetical protein
MGLAAAVAAVLGCGAAQAADVDSEAYDISSQALLGSTSLDPELVVAPIEVTLGADYAVNDTITLTFSGGTVSGPSTVTCVGPAGLLVSFINQPSANVFNYRVTFKNDLVDSTGDVCTWNDDGFTVDPSTLDPNGLAVTYSARATVPNLPLDEGGMRTARLFNIYDQFRGAVTQEFDGVVDVESGRQDFVGVNNDVLVLQVSNNVCDGECSYNPYIDGEDDIVADLDTVSIEIEGDFSYAGCGDDFNPALLTVQRNPAGGGTIAVADNCLSATITDVAPAEDITWTYTVTAYGGGGEVLDAAQSFDSLVEFAYTSYYDEEGVDSDTDDAGSWTLNGFSAFVPYMPYNDAAGISQIIYITNKSNQSSTLDIDAYNQAGVECSFTTTTVAGPGAVTLLTGDVKAGLEACYGAGFNDRVSFNVTGSLPGSLAELVTAYNVNGNRVQVINNSNGRVTSDGDSNLGGNL